MKLGSLVLRVSDLAASEEFYTKALGMRTIGRTDNSVTVSWPDQGGAPVRLVKYECGEDGGWCVPDTRRDAYVWLGTSNLRSVRGALEGLDGHARDVSCQGQLKGDTGNIAFVGHFKDPDGYTLEALQQELTEREDTQSHTAWGYSHPDERPVFGQLKINSKNPERTLQFYRDGLGMTLVSKMGVPGMIIILSPISEYSSRWPDCIDSEQNRTWLWQLRETQIEIQYWEGFEPDAQLMGVPHDAALGFGGFEVLCDEDPETVASALAGFGACRLDQPHVVASAGAVTILDPDGRPIHLMSS